MRLQDYAEILAYLTESIDGVTWNDIGAAFGPKFGAQEAVDAAGRLTLLGFTAGVEYDAPGGMVSLMPTRIRGVADGLDRLRECQRVFDNRGNASFRKGWAIEDSQRILEALDATE